MQNRIKILFTIPNFDTAGSGKVVYDLVKGLDKNKFAPEICCFHNRGEFFKEIEKLNVPIHIFKFAANYRPLSSLPFRILKISRFFRKNRFHIIHSWHWSSDFTEPLAAKLAGVPFIYTKKAMGWGNKSWKWRSALSSKIIAINTDMISQFFEDFKQKTSYLPLGVDVEKFKPLAVDNGLRSKLGITELNFTILSVANLVKVKGIEILLEAVKRINNDKIKVLIVGADHTDYAKQLKEVYADANIKFIGKQNDVRPFISVADLFVIPTLNEGRKEGLPIAPLEAMAMGKIVVGSNISGINDILKNHNNYLFEPSGIGELISKISTIMNYNDKEKQLEGFKMLKTVEKSYSLKQCIQSHSTIYCDLV